MTAGTLAEFAGPAELIAAVQRLRALGYARLEAFTPYPLAELPLPPGPGPRRVAVSVLIGGVAGALAGYGIQWWTAADYPLRVGAMPVHAVPAFIPITFESAMLAGALAALLAWAGVTGLPRWWDETAEVPGFARATSDRFFLLIDARERGYVHARSAEDLAACAPLRVERVGGPP